MIKPRRAKQWLIDGPAGVGLIAIALLAAVAGINNMAILGEVSCDRQADQTTSCTITTSHLTGSTTQIIEAVKSAQVLSSKTSSRENSGDQYRHQVWLSSNKRKSENTLVPLAIDSKNKPSQEALAQQINHYLSSNHPHLSLVQRPGLENYIRNAFIALLLAAAGCWGCIFLIRGMD